MNIAVIVTLALFTAGIIYKSGIFTKTLQKLDTDFDRHCTNGKERHTTLLNKMDSVKVELGEKITNLDRRVYKIELAMNGNNKKRRK